MIPEGQDVASLRGGGEPEPHLPPPSFLELSCSHAFLPPLSCWVLFASQGNFRLPAALRLVSAPCKRPIASSLDFPQTGQQSWTLRLKGSHPGWTDPSLFPSRVRLEARGDGRTESVEVLATSGAAAGGSTTLETAPGHPAHLQWGVGERTAPR